MTFDYDGYNLKFIQKEPCTDQSSHRYSLIFKFFSPVTKYHYVLRAEYHDEDFFAIKFYCKAHKRSDHKYHIIVNRGDIGNILITCLKVIPRLLEGYPNASFGFTGSRSIEGNKAESYQNNQRFRIYKELIPIKIGSLTFDHFEYSHVSSYLLINKKAADIMSKEREIVKSLCDTYTDLHDI